jgi:hypothetical protein
VTCFDRWACRWHGGVRGPSPLNSTRPSDELGGDRPTCRSGSHEQHAVPQPYPTDKGSTAQFCIALDGVPTTFRLCHGCATTSRERPFRAVDSGTEQDRPLTDIAAGQGPFVLLWRVMDSNQRRTTPTVLQTVTCERLARGNVRRATGNDARATHSPAGGVM